MEIAFLRVYFEERTLKRSTVDAGVADSAGAVCFKRSALLQDHGRDKLLASFHHQQKIDAFLIHHFNIRSTEVAAVDDDAEVFIAVFGQLLDHLLELRNVWNGIGIGLIEQRDLIGFVIDDGDIDDWQLAAILSVSEFDKVQIACLAVLIRRVVGDEDRLAAAPLVVPCIQESRDLIAINA